MLLRVAGVIEESVTDGPGFRYAVFTQGCARHCRGCQNPQTWDFDGGRTVDTDELFAQIETASMLRGVTFSGGEPFEQALPLAALAARVRERGLEVAAFSGYTFDELYNAGPPDARALLDELDILIDGEFILERKNLELKFRGSDNQRVIDVPASLRAGCAVQSTDERWIDF